jgi:neutral ceramidase
MTHVPVAGHTTYPSGWPDGHPGSGPLRLAHSPASGRPGIGTLFCRTLFILLLLCGTHFPAGAEFRAGAAKVSITPDVRSAKIPLGGYGARRDSPSTGVHDTIYARALVCSDGKTKAGIVSVDLCFLPANLISEIAKRVAAKGGTGLEADHLLIAATHTHSAPDPLVMHSGNTFLRKNWAPFDAKLVDFTADRIAEAIVQADRRQTAAKIEISLVEAKGWNRNRRESVGEHTTDTAMTLVEVSGIEGRPLAAIVNFAAHPTLYSDKMMEVSADWPGPMTASIEKEMGADAVCLFLNGAEGDASTNGSQGDTAESRVAFYGNRLGALAWTGLQKTNPIPSTPLAAWTRRVKLPPRKPRAEFLLAALQLGATLDQARQFVSALMPESTTLHFVRIGDLLLMGFPCEPTGEIGLAAKAAARDAGFKTPAVVALANDWLGYALTPEQYRAGNYEASMSFYGDQLGPTLLMALKTGLTGAKSGRNQAGRE